jgi:dienelactone hydrolase
MSPVRILLLAATLAVAARAAAQQVNAYEAVEFTVPRAAAGAARVVGRLRLPAASPAPVPAVLIVNTTPGFDGRSESYAQVLNAAGLATLEVDFFQGRGAQASPREHLPQVYESLRWLAARPGIAADRVGVMGFSVGGAIALLAASEPLVRAHAAGQARFAAHLALYPVCWRHHASATGGPGAWTGLRGAYGQWTGRPVHILSGGKDDYDGSQGCRPFLDALPQVARRHVSHTLLPDATFAWDSRLGSAPYEASAHQGRGGIVTVVANEQLARQSRDFAVAYFLRHLRAP